MSVFSSSPPENPRSESRLVAKSDYGHAQGSGLGAPSREPHQAVLPIGPLTLPTNWLVLPVLI